MRDKLSKVKNLVKKYGFMGTVKKLVGYAYSNYVVRISVLERLYVFFHRKEIERRIKKIFEKEDFDRIVEWRSSFG